MTASLLAQDADWDGLDLDQRGEVRPPLLFGHLAVSDHLDPAVEERSRGGPGHEVDRLARMQEVDKSKVTDAGLLRGGPPTVEDAALTASRLRQQFLPCWERG